MTPREYAIQVMLKVPEQSIQDAAEEIIEQAILTERERRTYKQGIPTEPGLYWYRIVLEGRAKLLIFTNSGIHCLGKFGELEAISRKQLVIEDGLYCPAIPPEGNDE